MGTARGIVGLLVLLLAALVAVPAAPAQPAATSPVPAAGRDLVRPALRLDRDGVLPAVDRRTGRAVIRSWPGRTIRYWADLPASYRWSLRSSIKAWNRTGLDMTFVRTSRADAQLKIVIGSTGGSDGLATVGYQRSNWIHLRRGLMTDFEAPYVPMGNALMRVVLAHTITHELGHVLGLQHRASSCGLMGAVLYVDQCTLMADRIGFYQCRIVDRNALERAVRRYGGRVVLAPYTCPVDPIPPALTGVAITGGETESAKVKLAWKPPTNPAADTRVQAIVDSTGTCTFPSTRDAYGTPYLDDDALEIHTFLPGKGSWTHPEEGIDTYCFALRVTNRSGGSPGIRSAARTLYLAPPAPPVVTEVSRTGSFEGTDYYRAMVTSNPEDLDLLLLVRPQGQCATTWPTGESFDAHRVHRGSDGYVRLELTGVEDPCLSFFTLRWELRTSLVAGTWQVGLEPVPPAPVVESARRRFDEGVYVVSLAPWDEDLHQLVGLASPEGQCVDTWPAGEDPAEHSVWPWGEGLRYLASDLTRACLSLFLVNADGVVGPAGTRQVLAAPPPTTPAITEARKVGDLVQVQATFDPDDRLVGRVGAIGGCSTAFPADDWPGDGMLWLDAGWWTTRTDIEHPCLVVYAVNDDGVVSPGVLWNF